MLLYEMRSPHHGRRIWLVQLWKWWRREEEEVEEEEEEVGSGASKAR